MFTYEFPGLTTAGAINKVTKITFPVAGRLEFVLISGAGGAGGNDAWSQGISGGNGGCAEGYLDVAANETLVFHAGSGGGTGYEGEYGPGKAGGGLLRGGRGGVQGWNGTSGGGGGGGAASFIMTLGTYNAMFGGASGVWRPLIVVGGGGGGAGAGLYGMPKGSIYGVRTSTINSLVGSYGEDGQAPVTDGGGGGGGGGGFNYQSVGHTETNRFAWGGGVAGQPGTHDTTAGGGSAGASYQASSRVSLVQFNRHLSGAELGLKTIIDRPYGNYGKVGGLNRDGFGGYVGFRFTPFESVDTKIHIKGHFNSVQDGYLPADGGGYWRRPDGRIFEPNTNGVVDNVYYRQNDQWVPVKDAYVKVDGAWVNVHHTKTDAEMQPAFEDITTTVSGPGVNYAATGWVNSTNGAWGSFMNQYAISFNNISATGENTFLTKIYIPQTGLYKVRVASDDTGFVQLNCKKGDSIAYFGYYQHPPFGEYYNPIFAYSLQRGEYFISGGYNNSGGGAGGIAILIYDEQNQVIWSTRAWRNGTYAYNVTVNPGEEFVFGNMLCPVVTTISPIDYQPIPQEYIYYGNPNDTGG